MRIVLFVLAAVTAVLMPAVYGLAGEEPTGFAEFPWSTPRARLVPVCGDPLLRQRPPLELWCSDRTIKIGDRQWFANLVFDDRGLGGYEITVRPFAYRDLRDIAVAKFGMYGRPADRQEVISYKGRIGERLMWGWPSGTFIILDQFCGGFTDDACLSVMSGPYRDALDTRRSRELDKAKKQF